jgi:DNA-binding SARP family transcriptional activator/Tfp pilus assembly protein PilF
MEFCLLGPLAVRVGGALIQVQPGKQRAVLAVLLLNANQVVPVDELAETLWGSAPPSARVTVRNYVKRLRHALGDAERARISTQPRGYLISVDAGELDVTRFEALLGTARAAARDGSWDAAAGQARAALALWRGEPLADVESEVLALREVPRLAEMRLEAMETRVDADLHLGRHAEVIGELRQLVAASPLRERLHALLMLALYRDSRQAEALAAYRQARQVLVEELGAEPGARLRELHLRMLTGDHALSGLDPAPLACGAPVPVVPRELPAAVGYFVGRERELMALTGLLDQTGDELPGTVVISAIGGTAGVGKTALAVHWAHLVAERFPDGQLYVNLRGYDPGQPMPAADALSAFLRALGVPGQDIPAEPDERASRYRSLLAGRRILVVLDNASEVEQVRLLLPGASACVALVTSRDSLPGLVARDGAHRLDLDLLPPEEAVGLLRALIGERVNADPDAATALAFQCCRLPLALRVAAELAVARPAIPLAGLAGELTDQQRRLDLLDVSGDPRTAVRAVFSWSCRHLDARAARAFRLLGLHPGPDLDPYAAAALTGTTVERAGHMLDQLARAHLIHTAGPGRYGMHDLLRAYARELAAAEDGEKERRPALTRLFDHYLHTAAAAMDTLVPAERHRRPRIPPPTTPAPPVTDPAAAREWLEAERASLAAAAGHTADHGWPGHTTRLAATLYRYLDVGGHCPEAITIYTCARRAARDTGDSAAEADALASLSAVDWRQGRCQQAAGHLQQALALHRETGDRAGEARVLANLGIIYFEQGRYQQAADHDHQALALFRETGDRAGEAHALHNLGNVGLRQGRYQPAVGHLQHALTLFRETGYRAGEAYALGTLGEVRLLQGRYQPAAGHLQQALTLFRETGDRAGEAYALGILGAVDLRLSRYQPAAGHLQQALALHRETGYRAGQAQALNGLGDVFLATGQPGDARAQHTTALALTTQIGDKYEQARAHDGLAHTYHATGRRDEAHHHWQRALTLYTDLGVPEADQVRSQLTTTANDGHREP